MGTPGGGASALLVFGSNLVVSTPDASAVQAPRRAQALLVVVDPFLSGSRGFADVVLPTCQWAEEEGTMTSLEGRILYRRPRHERPPAEVLTDLQILKRLAVSLGRGSHVDESPERVFDELRRCSAGGVADYSGITYARLRAGESIQWPCPGPDHPGTPRLFEERFATPDGRARFHAVRHVGPAEEPDEDYPFYLTTGRILAQYQSGTRAKRIESLHSMPTRSPSSNVIPRSPPPTACSPGDRVWLRTRRGRAEFAVRPVASMRLDTLFVPFHWGGAGRANNLTGNAVDAQSKIPEFKVSAAQIERLETDPQRVDPREDP